MNQHSIFICLDQQEGIGSNPVYMNGEYYGKRVGFDPL